MTPDTPALPAQEAHVEALARKFCDFAWGVTDFIWERAAEQEAEGRPGQALRIRDRMIAEARHFLASDWLAGYVADRQAEALREAANVIRYEVCCWYPTNHTKGTD